MVISPSTISTTQDFNVTVTVHNTGAVAGKEVVQVSLLPINSRRKGKNKKLVLGLFHRCRQFRRDS